MAEMLDADEIVEAAIEWVEAIHDYPGLWGDTTDFALVRAVLSAYPDVHPRGEVCDCGRACGSRADWQRFRTPQPSSAESADG